MSATPDGRPQIVEKNTMLDARQERERDYHADFAKRKPRRSEAGRKIGGLLQQIGRGREITPELKIAGEFVPAVGNQIAGGQEQSRGHLGTDFSLLETGLE